MSAEPFFDKEAELGWKHALGAGAIAALLYGAYKMYAAGHNPVPPEEAAKLKFPTVGEYSFDRLKDTGLKMHDYAKALEAANDSYLSEFEKQPDGAYLHRPTGTLLGEGGYNKWVGNKFLLNRNAAQKFYAGLTNSFAEDPVLQKYQSFPTSEIVNWAINQTPHVAQPKG